MMAEIEIHLVKDERCECGHARAFHKGIQASLPRTVECRYWIITGGIFANAGTLELTTSY